jgi:uncharacterized protein YbjT (DUF2867 family)
MKVAVAGASGFVGRALIDKIIKETSWTVVALSRSAGSYSHPRIQWVKADLFSYDQLSSALNGVNKAFYLVHSMLPSAQLDQGSFEDYDLLLADNFARASEKNNVSHVIYLGGIIPDKNNLSQHLRSRAEVETALNSKHFVTSHLRAGLIIGKDGSSFNIMYNLIGRLPVLACPSWTQNPMTPIDLRDVVNILLQVATQTPPKNQVYDIGGPNTYTYLDLLKICAQVMNKNRIFIKLPFSINFISRYWVRLFSGASKELVYPLLESLSTPMNINENRRYPFYKELTSYIDSLKSSIQNTKTKIKYTPAKYTQKFVRSVQRLKNSSKLSAEQVASLYFDWISKFLFPLIKIARDKEKIIFCLYTAKLPLIVLSQSSTSDNPNSVQFGINSGLLVSPNSVARIEFRDVIDRNFVLVAIHDFKPALPWLLYRISQAPLHAWVMSRFSAFLAKKSKAERMPTI